MQLPMNTTSVSRCIALAVHAGRMLSKFPQSPRLTELAQRMATGTQVLRAAQQAYELAAEARLVARVDIKFENYTADRRVQRTLQMAAMADGRRGGRVAAQVFPAGASAITRLQGESQILAMRDLEARLAGVQDIWPEAAAEKAAIEGQRQRYEQALAARHATERNIRDLRAARDAAKQRFLDLYAEIANLVRAEFPRDRISQDLFFDEVRTASGSPAGDTEPEPEPEPDDTIDEDASTASSAPTA